MNTAETSNSDFAFLTVVPRGLQHDAARSLRREAQALSHKNDVLATTDDDDEDDDLLKVTIWNREHDEDIGNQAMDQLKLKQLQKIERRLHVEKEAKHEKPRNDFSPLDDDWFLPENPLGSTPLESTGQHVSVGYTTKASGEYQTCWSCSGQMQGSVWMQLETKARHVSRSVVTESRCLGPLLALVTLQTDNICLEPSKYHTHSLDELAAEVSRHFELHKSQVATNLETAMQVWKDCVTHQWKNQLTPPALQDLQNRITKNQLRFRVSCLRQQEVDQASPTAHPGKRKKGKANAKDFAYTRQEFCRRIMDKCGSDLVPSYFDDTGKVPRGGLWKVDLQEFDIEIVLVILPGCLAMGISLRPYSLVKSKSFASGAIPPDISTPFLGGKVLADIIKLRSTTAHLLLEVADLQSYDVVLDPCAGIGTIPLEVDQYLKIKRCIGIGGDLVLSNPTFAKVAKSYTSNQLLLAWDAAYMPLGTSAVDAIVSDLPFGQKCLSMSSLNQLLPLVFFECARVLRPHSGRMILLCGGTPHVLVTTLNRLSGAYWKRPIRRISPVNVGGILAWVVRVERNNKMFGDGDEGGKQRYQESVRKFAEKRDQIGRHRKDEAVEQKASKRRRK
jgi:hypothetical protein